jgi:hypothetical protein
MSESRELIVSCISWQKAQALADVLLARHLITSVEFLPLAARVRKHRGNEAVSVQLIVQCPLENVKKTQQVVSRLQVATSQEPQKLSVMNETKDKVE